MPDTGLARMLDLTRVGAYGHSLGGPTVISAMNQDRRIDAGAALDGTLRGPVSFDRPFLMMGNQHERRVDDPDWAAFYDQLRGPRLHLVIDGAEHSDLTDITVFKSTIDISVVFPTGPIDGGRQHPAPLPRRLVRLGPARSSPPASARRVHTLPRGGLPTLNRRREPAGCPEGHLSRRMLE